LRFLQLIVIIFIFKALDQIKAKGNSAIDPVIDLMQLRSLPKEAWRASEKKFGGRSFMRRIDDGLRIALSLLK